jgi:hypothetical protein
MPLRVSRHELAGGLAGHVFGKMQSSDQKLMTACYSDWQICQSRTYSSTTTMRAYRNYRQFSGYLRSKHGLAKSVIGDARAQNPAVKG